MANPNHLEQPASSDSQRSGCAVTVALAAVVLFLTGVCGLGAFLFIQAKENERIARIAEADALKARELAVKEADRARVSEMNALEHQKLAREETERARRAEADAFDTRAKKEYWEYLAHIRSAAAKIEANAFERAVEHLNQCPEQLRDWEWGRLHYLCTGDVQTYEADVLLECVAVSPDGNRIATGGWNGKVCVSRFATAEDSLRLGESRTTDFLLDTGGTHVFAVAFSPDGKKLAVGCNHRPGYVQIWDAATGKRTQQLEGHRDAVLSVAFSKSGNRLLTSSYDTTARLWDLSTNEVVRVFRGHDWWVWSAAFSPKEDRIVTASQDGSAIVWSIDSDDRAPAFHGHMGPVYAAAFSRDGKHVASAGYDKRILVWNPDDIKLVDIEAVLSQEGAQPPEYRAIEGHSAAVRSVAFSRDGKLLISSADDNTVRLWDVATGKPLKILRGHSGRVTACVFCPPPLTPTDDPASVQNGEGLSESHVLSASHDRRVKCWSIAGFEEVRVFKGRVFKGHTDEILGVDFSPAGDRVVTASLDRSARLWNTSDGREIRTLTEGHRFLASTVIVFPGAKQILTAAADNTACIWDLAMGTQTMVMEGTGRNAAAALAPTGTWLLTGSPSKVARVWNAATGEIIRELEGHRVEVAAVAISPNGKYALTGDVAGQCILWDTEAWQARWNHRIHSNGVYAAAFLPAGKRVLTSSLDGTVARWDVETGEELSDLVLKHPYGVNALAITADGRRAITSCADRKLRLWDIETARELDSVFVAQPPFADIWKKESQNGLTAKDIERRKRQAVSSVAIDSSELQAVPRVVAVTEDNRARMWDISADDRLMPSGGDDNVVADLDVVGGLVWSATFVRPPVADGREDSGGGLQDAARRLGDYLLTVGGEEARLWDIESGEPMMSFGRQGVVASARFSPSGDQVVTASWDNAARIWDVSTGRSVRKLDEGHQGFVNSAVYSPDGRRIVTASDDKTIKIWNAQTGTVVQQLTGHTGSVRTAIFSPDGKFVLSASADKTAKIWDIRTGECLMTLAGHDQAVLAVAFSPDGKWVVTAGEDNTARLWDATTGQPIRRPGESGRRNSVRVGEPDQRDGQDGPQLDVEPLILVGHTAAVTAVAFSPTGSRIVTASADGTAMIWDPRTGREFLTLNGHSRGLTAALFSPDGKGTLTGSRDGTGIFWMASDWEPTEAVDVQVGRNETK